VTVTVGIDPGVTGAFAVLDHDGALIGVEDLPIAEYHSTRWVDAARFTSRLFALLSGKPARAFIEQTHAMPGMGSKASSSKGLTLGSVLAGVQMAQVSIELVSPATWKRALGLIAPKSTDIDRKRASLSRARLLYPVAPLEREKDHNRAEALLIAHWARERK
jgi:crossover junction endodeoxyribonuclease RuvC